MVIAVPSKEALGLDGSIERDFCLVTIVETGGVPLTAEATAASIRAASAPIIAFGEDHSFPEPGWAEALIEAHRGPWAAVGPEVRNGNPENMMSWANFLASYASWCHVEAGVGNDVPGRNSSYKRSILLDFGPELVPMLEREGHIDRELKAKGYQLYLEPKAKTNHVNVSLPGYAISLLFNAGRLFAASRSQKWPLWRRLVYIGGSPLIPVVETRRLVAEIRRIKQEDHLLPRILPALAVVTLASAAGELVGYIFGPGAALQTLRNFKRARVRHITRRSGKPLRLSP